MYTFIMYDGDTVLDTEELHVKPVISGNKVRAGESKFTVNKPFIIIEGSFDGVLDTSQDISPKCKPEEDVMQERIDSAETTIENLMMEIATLKGGI